MRTLHKISVSQTTGIIHAKLSGAISIQDLSDVLNDCLIGNSQSTTRVLFEVTDLQVRFTSSEVAELVASLQALEIRPGKLAFVTDARQGFLSSLVSTVRELPGQWNTQWQTFQSLSQAQDWLQE